MFHAFFIASTIRPHKPTETRLSIESHPRQESFLRNESPLSRERRDLGEIDRNGRTPACSCNDLDDPLTCSHCREINTYRPSGQPRNLFRRPISDPSSWSPARPRRFNSPPPAGASAQSRAWSAPNPASAPGPAPGRSSAGPRGSGRDETARRPCRHGDRRSRRRSSLRADGVGMRSGLGFVNAGFLEPARIGERVERGNDHRARMGRGGAWRKRDMVLYVAVRSCPRCGDPCWDEKSATAKIVTKRSGCANR